MTTTRIQQGTYFTAFIRAFITRLLLLCRSRPTHLELTPGTENVKKTMPIGVQMEDLAAESAGGFPLLPQDVPYENPESLKHTPGMHLKKKVFKWTATKKPKALKIVKMGSYCSPSHQYNSKIFHMGEGAFL